MADPPTGRQPALGLARALRHDGAHAYRPRPPVARALVRPRRAAARDRRAARPHHPHGAGGAPRPRHALPGVDVDGAAPLAEAAAHQPEFRLHDVAGTCVGFWSPGYARTFEVPGHHPHFLADARTAGGHVLGLAGRDRRVRVQTLHDFRVALPDHDAFVAADLSHDPAAALERVEK